jgi:hypothetical protein
VGKENEGLSLSLGDVVSSVGAALGLIAAWLYVAGWTYAYAYFDRFRIPLLLVDIPFQHMLVFGGLVFLKNLWLSAPIATLVIFGLWSLSRWFRQLGRFIVNTAIVVGIIGGFALAHAGGILTANDDFQAERSSDYEAYPRLRLILKKDMAETPSEALGDAATTDCDRLLAATKDRLFLVRPSRNAPGADIDTYVISAEQVLAMRITGNYTSCE